MPKALVIVESPTKARTLARFLDSKRFVVESSIGHIRDLPSSAKEIPEEYKKEKWARLGIDIENDFAPLYVIPPEKKKQVSKLRALLKEADEVYLATDEDREGESISWHLCEVLKPKVPRRRLVFHEITKEAIHAALEHPRDIDDRLVEAQETRRILDRLYGYEVSPVLWKKIRPRLSAGRVQSVAVRMIVERERERRRFVAASYWDLLGVFEPAAGPAFPASLVRIGERRLASGKDFDEMTGELKEGVSSEVLLLDEERARELRGRLESAEWKVLKVERKPYTTRPAPPFTTSTLQQEANRKLHMSARRTMQAAQRLYENGHITYMRTDSVHLAEQALERVRELVSDLYGPEYLPGSPRRYKTQVKNAQEAHEAIRPSTEFLRPEELKGKAGAEELRLYELIWKRTVACQMEEARGHRITLQVGGAEAVFQASGKTIEFPGFLRVYVEGADDPEAELADKETLLPDVDAGDPLELRKLEAKSHTTQPPARYTEASLVKELESNGIGRPSTYASIIDTIQRRDYVFKQKNALVPTFTAFAVVQLLERFFSQLVDVQFTARMENDLDRISVGKQASLPYLKQFYFGVDDEDGLADLIQKEIDARESCTLRLGKDSQRREVDIRVGPYGPYLQRGEERASIPQDLPPDELTVAKAEELLAAGAGQNQIGTDPASGKPVYLKVGRYGPYVQLGDDEDRKMKSLPRNMEPQDVSLETALALLSLPRRLGADPESGEDIFADLGRYGPYVKRGSETRSLKEGDDLFHVGLSRAVELLREEKKGGWRARFEPKVLRELGERPDTKAPLRVLSGRYGPYVTDGETNASVPRGQNAEELTMEEAIELLRRRAESGPSRRGRGKAPPKVGKKSPSPAKRATSRKSVPRKAAAKKKSAG